MDRNMLDARHLRAMDGLTTDERKALRWSVLAGVALLLVAMGAGFLVANMAGVRFTTMQASAGFSEAR